MTEPRIDTLLQRLANMNRLVDLVNPGEDDEEQRENGQRRSGSKGKSGKGQQGGNGGLFGAAKGEMLFRRGARNPSILSITDPSDGHPQEELTPDFNWFRSLTYNNPTWTLYWPDLII
jgi:hypothetical protein